ncbi:MAG: zinc ribbon domain-containing protein [Deltaproteobacteria bacterium]|nr:zinc ribbon domain-containing protein [Deltaproteobacteria bacterium]
MVSCPKCGHQNLPSSTTCSKCGTPLPVQAPAPAAVQVPVPGPAQPPPPAVDGVEEYARQMAAREAVRRRNRMIIGGVVLVLIGFVAFKQVQDRKRKAVVQEKLTYAEKFVELEKRETGAFWNCVMASEVDIGMFQKAEQFQQRIESAYFTQQKTFADYLVTECVPKIERARQAFGGLRDTPTELAGPIEKYRETLPKLQTGLENYVENIKNRGSVKDTDQLIQELGTVWHSVYDITAETAAYEKFLYCAIPDLAKMKDAQEVLEYMKDQCYTKDPVLFMERVRKDCGPLLVVADKEARINPKSVPTWKQSHKLFLEEEMRQLQAWDSCARRSRKGKKKEDLEQFLLAVNDYMAARADVAKAARGIQEGMK